MQNRPLLRLFVFAIVVTTAWLSATPCTGQGWLERLASSLSPTSRPARELAALRPVATRDDSIRILANTFRERARQRNFWMIPPPQGEPDLAKADRATQHIIEEYGSQQFGDTLPWFDPNKKIITLARFPHFDPLVQAYVATDNEKYARAIARDIRDFLDRVPRPQDVNAQPYGEVASNPWQWVLLYARLLRWIDVLHYLGDSPSLSDEVYLRAILRIWEEANWLSEHADLGLHNATLANARALYATLVSYPESIYYERWLSSANETFGCFVHNYFYPAGISIELTLGYSAAVLSHCLDIALKIPQGLLPEKLLRELEAITEGHIALMKPDRSLPRYGDHGLYDIRNWLLAKATQLFDRQDWYTLLSGSDGGRLPAFTSFPPKSGQAYHSGYYVMRDGWSAISQYLVIDAGPFGTNHQHADRLSICLSADGADFIVDPGTAIYRSTSPNTHRFDLRPGYLHNVVCVDGIDPARGWMRDYRPAPLDNRWVTNDTYDYLEASYHFQPNGLDVTWRRAVLYVRGEYWVLLDWLSGPGAHKVASNFQCAIGSRVDVDSSAVRIRAANGAQLLLVSASSQLRPQVVIGDTLPRRTTYPLGIPSVDWRRGGRGWVGTFGNETPLDPSSCYPAPAIVREGIVKFPHIDAVALVPSQNGQIPSVRMYEVANTGDSLGIVVELDSAGTKIRDLFCWTPPRQPERYGFFPSGSGWWLRTVDGKFRQAAILRAQSLRAVLNGWKITGRFSRPFEGYLELEGSHLRLYVDHAVKGSLRIERLQVEDPAGRVYVYADAPGKLPATPDGAVLEYLKPGHTYLLEATIGR